MFEWRAETAAGEPIDCPLPAAATREEADAILAAQWLELADAGASTVILSVDGSEVYRMSLEDDG